METSTIFYSIYLVALYVIEHPSIEHPSRTSHSSSTSFSHILYFCLFVCFFAAQPWDSSTPLPCSDTFWERRILEQLQGPFIVGPCQCTIAGQWHARWMSTPIPLSLKIICTLKVKLRFSTLYNVILHIMMSFLILY